MARRLILLVTLTILLAAMSSVAYSVRKVEVDGTVYIRADGRVEPSTAPISNFDATTYTFIDDINEPIMVERSNITVDGAGYALQGAGMVDSKGLYLSGTTNVTVKNMKISGFGYGIYLVHSSDNYIVGNSVENNGYGIYLSESSSNNMLRNNNMVNNSYNLGVYGVNLLNFVNDVDVSNTVDDKPVYYWISRQMKTVPGDAGYVALVNCSNILVQNLNIERNGQGILLAYTENSTITKNNLANNEQGIWLYKSSNNNLSENTIAANNRGIWLTQSSNNNTVYRNNIMLSKYDGIYLFVSSNNNIYENKIGVNSEFGIYLLGSSNNTIYHNNFMSNKEQVYLYGSFDNTWNDEHASYGNYWSDHNPPDEDKDKMGDSPYVIDEDNVDRYPLIYPYGFVPSPDLNGDRKVDIRDVTKVALAFGSKPGDNNWNPIADLNNDEVIDIRDITVVALEFGKTA